MSITWGMSQNEKDRPTVCDIHTLKIINKHKGLLTGIYLQAEYWNTGLT